MMREITVDAVLDQLDGVLAFLNRFLDEISCPFRIRLQLEVAVEELFVNIVSYAYQPGSGQATIRLGMESEPPAVTVTLTDSGIPYDPMAKPDPDVTLPAEKRQIGGLGIYMVKKTMDAMKYEYRNGQNTVVIKKNLP